MVGCASLNPPYFTNLLSQGEKASSKEEGTGKGRPRQGHARCPREDGAKIPLHPPFTKVGRSFTLELVIFGEREAPLPAVMDSNLKLE